MKYKQKQRSCWKCFLWLEIQHGLCHLENAPQLLWSSGVHCLHSVSCGLVYFLKNLEWQLLSVPIRTAESCSPVDNSDFVCIPLFFCFICNTCLLKNHLPYYLFTQYRLFWNLKNCSQTHHIINMLLLCKYTIIFVMLQYFLENLTNFVRDSCSYYSPPFTYSRQ